MARRRRGADEALSVVRQCIALGDVITLQHFTQRLDERGLFWADVLSIFDDPEGVTADGRDQWGRERWLIRGDAADGSTAEIVCVIEENLHGQEAVFITIYGDD